MNSSPTTSPTSTTITNNNITPAAEHRLEIVCRVLDWFDQQSSRHEIHNLWRSSPIANELTHYQRLNDIVESNEAQNKILNKLMDQTAEVFVRSPEFEVLETVMINRKFSSQLTFSSDLNDSAKTPSPPPSPITFAHALNSPPYKTPNTPELLAAAPFFQIPSSSPPPFSSSPPPTPPSKPTPPMPMPPTTQDVLNHMNGRRAHKTSVSKRTKRKTTQFMARPLNHIGSQPNPTDIMTSPRLRQVGRIRIACPRCCNFGHSLYECSLYCSPGHIYPDCPQRPCMVTSNHFDYELSGDSYLGPEAEANITGESYDEY
ncbi:hypothetical protein BDZ94DRAFT_1269823 [Collybia nuda]|uniref:Uncharacterized protein n=1 Tax=Collybia nuda TaxID=64659 RepID=A0A9P5XXZ3_9AGAR|nr:hypothetical protein BDZ94DRAFT_1269823 [Collybia nuda]